jgi:hypothetical protein
MTISVRSIETRDIDDVLELNEAAIPAVNSLTRQEMLWFADNAACFRVALRKGSLAGFLIGLRPGLDYASRNYQWFCRRHADFGYVDRIVVAEAGRRLGIGSRLYADFAAALAGEVPVMTCEVNLSPPNPGSMAFHAREGFREVGRQHVEGGRKEVALMDKRLAHESH